MRNLIRALMGKPVQLSAKQEEKLARMRARAEAMGASPNGVPAPSVRELIQQSLEQARTELGGMFDDRRDVLDPGPGADLNRPPAEVDDAVQREALIRGERAARLATRRPFQAPAAPEIAFTRVATT